VRADLYRLFYATSWRAPRSGGRRAPKGRMPFGNPQCEKGAALSLCLSFRKNIHLQPLRARVKETRAHFMAKALAFLACRSWWLKSRHSTGIFYVTSRLSLCRAAREQFPKAAAFGAFSWFVLCRAAKNEHPCRHSAARSSMRVKRRSCLKFSFLSFVRRTTRGGRAYATSWHSPRSSQEGNQGDTPWDPTARRLFKSRRGFLSWQASSILVA